MTSQNIPDNENDRPLHGPYAETGLERDDDTRRWVRPLGTTEPFESQFPVPPIMSDFRISEKSRTKLKGQDITIRERTPYDAKGRQKYKVTTKRGTKTILMEKDLEPSEPEQFVTMVRSEQELQDLLRTHRDKIYSWKPMHSRHPDFQGEDELGIAHEWAMWEVLEINKKIRDGIPLTDRQQQIVDNVLSKSKPLTQQEILWRGLQKPPDADYTPGSKMTLKHPESATRVPNVAFRFTKGPLFSPDDEDVPTIYQILTPKGTPAMVYFNDLSEVVLPPGTQLEVIDAKEQFESHPGYEPITFVTLRVVPEDDSRQVDVYPESGDEPRRYQMRMADPPGGTFYHSTPVDSRIESIDIAELSEQSDMLCPGIYTTRDKDDSTPGSTIEMSVDWQDVDEIPSFSHEGNYEIDYDELADDACAIARSQGYPAFLLESNGKEPVLVLTESDQFKTNLLGQWGTNGQRINNTMHEIRDIHPREDKTIANIVPRDTGSMGILTAPSRRRTAKASSRPYAGDVRIEFR